MQDDKKIVKRAVEKVLEKYDFDIEDMLESEDVEQAIKDEILDQIDDAPPSVDWIQMVELDEVEEHKNKNGDFLSN